MQKRKCVVTLACVVALATPLTASANIRSRSGATAVFSSGSMSGSGGTLTAGKQTGQSITIQGVLISGVNEIATITCSITFFGVSTYKWTWNCSGGAITITDASGSIILSGKLGNATMNLTGAGGGRGGHTTYTYKLSGTFSGSQKQGATTQSINGSIATTATTRFANGSPGKVTSFTLSWNAANAMIGPVKLPCGRPQAPGSLVAENRLQ
jgi:hypothetical protein